VIPRNLYWERPPPAALRRHVACMWASRVTPGTEPFVQRVVPDGCMDIIWLDGWLHVAGPDTRALLAPLEPGALLVGVRFRPGLAPTVLGVPAAELRDARVGLDALWGRPAGRLAERLAGAPGAEAAMALLEREVGARLPAARAPDPLAEEVVRRLRRAPPAPVVSGLAAALGASERQLYRRCLDAFGYGPKTLDRVLRFQRFLALARQAGPARNLARQAAEAGYADQAHLSRECRSLAGLPPSLLLATDPPAVAS
jgi:AraC-like DNA-binding protein